MGHDEDAFFEDALYQTRKKNNFFQNNAERVGILKTAKNIRFSNSWTK